jgi:tetratricopeptide (TPR) repeat protein
VFRPFLLFALLISGAFGQALDQARQAFKAGNYARAAELFENANAATPDCETTFYAGLARYRLNQFDAALIAFKSAVECDPKLIEAYLALGEAYIHLRNETEALRAYTQALNVAPRNTAALRGAAAIYLRNDNNEKAAALLETLAAIEPKDAQARVDLAAACAATGKRDKAEAEFKAALGLSADNASALTGLGNLYQKEGGVDRAVPLLLRAVKVAPNAFEPRFVLGSIYNRQGRFAEARTELEAALRLGGAQSAEVYYQLARAYGSLGLTDERRTMLARFSELTDKSRADSENQRTVKRLLAEATSLIDSGDLRTAVERIEAARALQPANSRILFRLAGLYYDLKKYDSARACAQKAIQLAPSEWVYHFLLGLTEADSGHLPESLHSLEIAARLNPSGSDIQSALEKVRHAMAVSPEH